MLILMHSRHSGGDSVALGVLPPPFFLLLLPFLFKVFSHKSYQTDLTIIIMLTTCISKLHQQKCMSNKTNKQTTTTTTNQPYYFAVNKQPYTSVPVSISPTHLMRSRSPLVTLWRLVSLQRPVSLWRLVSLWRRLGVKRIQHGWWSVMKEKTAT